MSPKLLQALLVVAILLSVNSVPFQGEHNIQSKSSHVSGRHKERQSYQQHPLNRFQCSLARDCYPPEFSTDNISSDYISCSGDFCVCQDCFVLINDTCEVAQCHSYDSNTSQCVDNRISQKDVVLLSAFLSSIGAANFYIEQDVLGAVQLAILVLALFACVCTPFCIRNCCSEDSDTESFLQTCCCVCLVLLAGAVVLCCFVAIVGWWAADLIILIQNGRADGNGCPLRPDL